MNCEKCQSNYVYNVNTVKVCFRCIEDDISNLRAENANFLSKINLALFIMKDNEWHNDEGSIEYQVYKILEKAIEEL